MMTAGGYLVVSLETGAMDGWYGREADARAVLDCFRERGGRWALLRAVDLPAYSGIADRVWHVNMGPDQYVAEAPPEGMGEVGEVGDDSGLCPQCWRPNGAIPPTDGVLCLTCQGGVVDALEEECRALARRLAGQHPGLTYEQCLAVAARRLGGA